MMIESMTRKVKRRDIQLLAFFILLNCRFYNCTIYSVTAIKWLTYIGEFIIAFYFFFCFLHVKRTNTTFLEKTVILLLGIFGMSIVNGILHGEEAIYVIRTGAKWFCAWGIFYFLSYKNFDEKTVLDVLWKFVMVYMVIRLLCYVQFPDCWFGMAKVDVGEYIEKIKGDYETRGVLRISLPFAMVVPLFIFQKMYRFELVFSNLMSLGVLFFYMILLGNRFPLFTLGVVGCIVVLFSTTISTSQKVKLMVAGLFLVILVYYLPFTHNVMENLLSFSEEQAEANAAGHENIRITMATYMFTEYNGDNIYKILFGNGLIVPNAGGVAKEFEMMQEEFGFFTSDVGYCFLYISFGLIGVLMVLVWFVAAMRIKVERQYIFIKFFFSFIMLSMIAGGYWFEDLLVMSVLTYVLVKSSHRVSRGITR